MRAWPLTSRAPMAARIAKFAESDESITRRRGRRSATTPPINSVEIWASVQQAKAIPTSVADPVRSSTANATAIGARFVPKNEIVRAVKRRRKLRSRSGPRSGRKALLPVSLETRIRLPERHRELVDPRVDTDELCADRPAEFFLGQPGRDPGSPGMKPLTQLVQVAPDVRHHAEVHQRQSFGRPAFDLVERQLPRLEVEVGWRRRGQDDGVGWNADTGCVAGVERPVVVEVADVMSRVSRCREAIESEDAISHDMDVVLGDGSKLSPERVERVAVQPARARLEAARV